MEHLYREGGFWCGTDGLFLCLVRLVRISVSQALFLLPKIYRHRRENGGIGMIIYTIWKVLEKMLKEGAPVSLTAESSLL